MHDLKGKRKENKKSNIKITRQRVHGWTSLKVSYNVLG